MAMNSAAVLHAEFVFCLFLLRMSLISICWYAGVQWGRKPSMLSLMTSCQQLVSFLHIYNRC